MGEKHHAIDQTQSRPDQATVEAVLAVLDRFMMALNSGDEPAPPATLHFPHYRLAGGGIRVSDRPGSYLGDFRAGWHYSQWDFSQHHRRRAGENPPGRAIHPLCARQPQMDFSGKIALVIGALSGSRISLKMPGGGVHTVVAGTRFEAFG